MNSINIPYFDNLNGKDAYSASLFLDNIDIFYKIEQVNWPEKFLYCPQTSFIIARSEDTLFLKFIVEEKNLRALYLNDHDPVWEDSCVEFFFQKANDDTYMNFEFNCIGTCLAASRKGRSVDVLPLPESQMKKIERYSTLERKIYNLNDALTHWELTVKIPFTVLGIDPEKLPDYLKGNFYKCGDGTLTPHYISWNSIFTENPDFHCPEYFGKLNF
jgi:hypothetical protein